jgi:MoxR-like ATPase
MTPTPSHTFVGAGHMPGRTWWRAPGDPVEDLGPASRQPWPDGHPAAYVAADLLVAAVNTALILRKPLLVTGKPGTGKSELAERLAYEFDLGAVLRFEAQSLSEANDLFYRFDYMRQMVTTKLMEGGQATKEDALAMNFVEFGPLGWAVLRALGRDELPEMVARHTSHLPATAARSVVLIDEIDKASRDFPNDLLNGIDRLSFTLREAGNTSIQGPQRDSALRPIVVVTSNSERDLPAPFLRRCVFVHIDDPTPEQLAAIVRRRVFGDQGQPPTDEDGLPPLYAGLLRAFVELRDHKELRHRIGTSELLDLAQAARDQGMDGHDVGPTVVSRLLGWVSAMAKHPDDRQVVAEVLRTQLAAGVRT